MGFRSVVKDMNDEVVIDKNVELFPEEGLKEMVEAGVFYGRKKTKTYPKMRPYILTNRGGIEIINLNKSLTSLDSLLDFVREKIKAGAKPILVGTQPAAFQAILDMASEFNFAYVINRWVGGTLTNFKVISKRVEYFKKLRNDLKAGAFEGYTKKEKADLEGKVQKSEELFGGLDNLDRLPDFLLVVDPNLHTTAVKEARRMKIPVVAFANVDSDPVILDYFVVGNNKAKKSVEWFLSKVTQAIRDGKTAASVVPEVTGAK